MRRWACLGAALWTAAAAPLEAQQISVWLGGGHTRFADSLTGWAATGGARLALQSANAWVSVDGYVSSFDSGYWATDLQGSVGLLAPVGRTVALGLRARGYANYFESGGWSGLGLAGAYAAIGADAWLGTLGASAGWLGRIDGTSDFALTGRVTLHGRAGVWSFDAGLAGLDAGDTAFADATLGTGLRFQGILLDALVGVRVGDLADDPWIQLLAEWQVLRGATLEAGVGTYPEDITGFASGFFARLGVRIGTPRRRAAFAPPRPVLEILPLGAAQTRVIFRVAQARHVEIAGEWNAWTPQALTKLGGGRWQAVLPLGTGAYRFSLVVDGEDWVVPPGVPELPDDWGGTVGLLVIGER